ncbi:ECF RNA polymerase sigma factor SigW [Dictyobacter alpinus]|uniref:ECF RNA polymerase sigma factor SigW n=1 Tax=Dictyobacter alpinus TaxID=2014873 RepID=A0A402B2R0_9CHLR|nr:sigma-70 family RNA polymerase sigma factor [Dictyobacter alpinus]GCE25618.1 ECF RNA polymerase sigma factor SigW [Dictyobacter alpinus]
MKLSPQSKVTDAALIDELYRQYARNILRLVRRQINLLEDAEDIMLEVFIAALQSETFTKLNNNEQQAWLYRVAYNKCFDYHRTATRRPVVPLDLVITNLYAEDEYQPHNIAIQQEEYRVLQQHLSSLTDQQREILLCKFGQNMSSPEIAKRLNKSDGAVRMILARTIKLLREIYTRDDEGRKRS